MNPDSITSIKRLANKLVSRLGSFNKCVIIYVARLGTQITWKSIMSLN